MNSGIVERDVVERPMTEPETTSPGLRCSVCPDPSEGEGEWLAAVEVVPPDRREGSERPPLDLLLVVDRSSSMIGSRIAAAIETARQICLRLTQRDRLGVVAFDSGVHTVLEPGPPAADTADSVAMELTELGVGYGTNISGGWKRAAELIARGGVPGSSKTVLLITDGLPSRGLMKGEELEALATAGRAQGIVTSTVGIGQHFDERLLSAMATAGGGAYRFAEHDEDTPGVADSEVEGMEGVVAESSVLHVGFAKSVRRFEVLHDVPCRAESDGLAIELGRLYAARPRLVLIEIASEPGADSFGAVGLSCLGADGEWAEAGMERILVPAPGQEEADAERVGAALVPLRVARWQQKIWECGRDANPARLIDLMGRAARELGDLSAPFARSAEARDALARFERGCERITNALKNTGAGDAERRRQTEAAYKTMTEESTHSVLGVTRVGGGEPRRHRGWGKR
jgi:uncharacterized protein YegL